MSATSTRYRDALARIDGLNSFHDQPRIQSILDDLGVTITELRARALAEQEMEGDEPTVAALEKARSQAAEAKTRADRIEAAERVLIDAESALRQLDNEHTSLAERRDRLERDRTTGIEELDGRAIQLAAECLADGALDGEYPNPAMVQSYDNALIRLSGTREEVEIVLPAAIKLLDERIQSVKTNLDSARKARQDAAKALEKLTR